VDHDLHARIGARIRAARTKAGMSQAQLSGKIGMSRSSVANLEAGRQGIPAERLVTLGTVLDLDLADLLPVPGVTRNGAGADLEVAAMSLMVMALAPLGEPERARVLAWASARYAPAGEE
jgi:transcriptional regulator with XRE-family HTH domain